MCKLAGVQPHPARFPEKLPAFFIDFLTDPGDTVLDFFAGSNTSGAVAESAGRRWLAFDNDDQYLAASAFRFMVHLRPDSALAVHERLRKKPNSGVRLPQLQQRLAL